MVDQRVRESRSPIDQLFIVLLLRSSATAYNNSVSLFRQPLNVASFQYCPRQMIADTQPSPLSQSIVQLSRLLRAKSLTNNRDDRSDPYCAEFEKLCIYSLYLLSGTNDQILLT
ncbi:hypothetical protein LINPERPRIM_LOCUS16246 [Linum perenne]